MRMTRQRVARLAGALCLVTAGAIFVPAVMVSPLVAVAAAIAVVLVVVGVGEIG